MRRSFTILAIDDDPDTLAAVDHLLRREGHRVLCASTGRQGLAMLAEHEIHVMLVDYFLPDMSGAEVVERARSISDIVQIILQTAYAGECPPRDMLRRLEIQGYHDKTDGWSKLLQWVDIACRTYGALERSRRSERLKSQLVANVSHELRTPLNVILGYVDLLRDGAFGPQTPAATDALTTLNRQALALLQLIDDLLDMSKLQAGAMRVAREPVCVSAIVDEFREALPILVGDRPVVLQWEVPPGAYALGDARKVRIVVQNLISNAAKFTATGEIAVGLRINGSSVVVTVRDSGPGIPADAQERIFQLFEQVDGSATRIHGGTGLGLYLARELARLMGGDITLESAVGQGSTFTFTLPATT